MIQSAGQRKARGASFTPPEVSRSIADGAIRAPGDRVLEPSCGAAAFLLPAAERLVAVGLPARALADQLDGVDVHAPSLGEAGARLRARGFATSLVEGDFFDQACRPTSDAVIGNPPFVRRQDLSGEARAKGLQAARAPGARLTGLARSWAAFAVHAASFLKQASSTPMPVCACSRAATIPRAAMSSSSASTCSSWTPTRGADDLRADEVGRPDEPVPLDEAVTAPLRVVAERNPDFHEPDDQGRLRPAS